MSLELSITAFDAESAATNTLKVIDELDKTGIINLYDAAVVSKKLDGTTKIKDTRDISGSEEAQLGAISGGLLGLRDVAALEVAGEAVGGVAAAAITHGFPSKDLNALADLLPPDSSALLLFYEDDLSDRSAKAAGSRRQIPLTALIKDDISILFATSQDKVKNHWAEMVTSGKHTLENVTAKMQTHTDKAGAELKELKASAVKASSETRTRNDAEVDKLYSGLTDQWAALEGAYFAQLNGFKAFIYNLSNEAVLATGDAKAKIIARLAEAQAEYKEIRKKFKTNAQISLTELNSQVDSLKDKVEALEGEAQVKANLLLLELKTRQEQAESILKELKTDSDAARGDVERGWSNVWHELRQAYQQAAREFIKV